MTAGWSYTAGACNIGRAEVRKRARAAWGGLALTAVVAAILAVSGAARPWRLVLFLPVALVAVGFVQARGKT